MMFSKNEKINGGGETPVVENPGVGARAQAVSETEEAVKKVRKTYTKKSGLTPEQQKQNASLEKIAADLEKIFDPSIWEPLMALPANAMLAWTGDERTWNLSEKEIKTMGQTASAAMRYVGLTDPKYLAIAMMFASIAMVYAPRTIRHLAIVRENKK